MHSRFLASAAVRGTPLLLVGGVLLVGSGCDTLSYYPYDCAELSECPGDNCPGVCVPVAPLGFDGPALLWIGSEAEAPGCPSRAPTLVYEGHADLVSSAHECPPCACAGATCQFPPSLTASNTAACQGPGFTSFDAPAFWNGGCTAASSTISSGALRSVSIASVGQAPCAPVPAPVPQSIQEPSWGIHAKACAAEPISDVCNDRGMTCLPSAEPPPPGFRQCLMSLISDVGLDVQCPADYPEVHVLYGGADDTRACTACSCTETASSTCLARLTTFEDGTCNPAEQLFSAQLSSGQPLCLPIMPSTAELGSMRAEWLTNEPGTCVASGGVPIGEVKPVRERSFCCQPLPGG